MLKSKIPTLNIPEKWSEKYLGIPPQAFFSAPLVTSILGTSFQSDPFFTWKNPWLNPLIFITNPKPSSRSFQLSIFLKKTRWKRDSSGLWNSFFHNWNNQEEADLYSWKKMIPPQSWKKKNIPPASHFDFAASVRLCPSQVFHVAALESTNKRKL